MNREFIVDFVFEGYIPDETITVVAESKKEAVLNAKSKLLPELESKIIEIYVHDQNDEPTSTE